MLRNMLYKILVLSASLFFLSACSSSVGQKANNQHVMEFERIVGDRVFFALNSNNLSEESKTTLMKQASWLNKHKSFNITVSGHCDARGTREINIALGERRADVVKRFLVGHDVSEHRIEIVSYGKEKPAVIGDNEDAWSKNRRAVTELK